MNILITGARSNLGYSYATFLAKKGHIVYAGVKTQKEKEGLEERLFLDKIIMFPIIIDLLDEKTFKVIDDIKFDVIILQAGIGEGGSVLELNSLRLRKNIDVNIIGNFVLLQRYLRNCVFNKRSGKIFITSSLASFLPLPYLSSYTASKIYLYSLAKTLKREIAYQKLDVSISLVLPGAYYTGFNEVMINNKEKDKYILKREAVRMTLFQKILFALIENVNYDDLSKKVCREVLKKKPKFIISSPYYQKLFTKLYVIITTLLEC